MKMGHKLSLLTMALALAACNEKVSPELQDSSISSTPTPTAVTKYTFQLTNEADPIYNFKMHKTGAGNANEACKVESENVPFSKSTFSTPGRDITCYLEAEELSLYGAGLKFKIAAAPNTCEFITYAPYSYYNRMPGSSTTTYAKVSCIGTTTNSHVTASPSSAALASNSGPIKCNEFVNVSDVSALIKTAFTPETEDDLCVFNYKDGDREQCDIGTVTIQEYRYTLDEAAAVDAAELAGDTAGLAAVDPSVIADYSDGVDGDGGGPDDDQVSISAAEYAAIRGRPDYLTAYNTAYNNTYNSFVPNLSIVTRTKKCGGKAANCVKGPLKETSGFSSTAVNGRVISPAVKDASYSQTYTYPALLPDRPGTFVYANYRRNLADVTLDIMDQLANMLYAETFLDQKSFDPLVLERYARNRNYINTASNVQPADYTAIRTSLSDGGKYYATPLAAEPMMGLSAAYQINPFYTFECLDSAREMKARIRLVVRDWDRIFWDQNPDGTDNSNLELLSDIYMVTDPEIDNHARMDYIAVDPDDELSSFNDYEDWDDLIPMSRDSANSRFRPSNGLWTGFPEETDVDED